jgi:hypothetical protein
MMRAIIVLAVVTAAALTLGACRGGIPYAATPYHFPSYGGNEGTGG